MDVGALSFTYRAMYYIQHNNITLKRPPLILDFPLCFLLWSVIPVQFSVSSTLRSNSCSGGWTLAHMLRGYRIFPRQHGSTALKLVLDFAFEDAIFKNSSRSSFQY